MQLKLKNKKITNVKLITVIIIFIFLLDILIGNYTLRTSGPWIRTKFMDYKYLIILVLILILFLYIYFHNKFIRVDEVAIILMIRSSILIINSIKNNYILPDSWKMISMVQISVPIIYFIFINFRYDFEKIYLKISIIVSSIMSVQILYNFVYSIFIENRPWNYVKASILIPVGLSNYLASILFILFIYINIVMEWGIKKTTIKTLIITALLATMSDGIYGLMIIYAVIHFVFIKKNNAEKGNYPKKIFMFILVVAIVFVVWIGFKEIFLGLWNQFSKNTQKESADALFNGRFSVYEYNFRLFMENPLWGWGLGTSVYGTTRSHNLILQLLVSGGVLNLIMFMYIYLKNLIINFKMRKEKRMYYATFLILIFFFMHSMVEPTIQTRTYDFVFFVLISMSASTMRNRRS